MKYYQLTENERYQIYALKKAGLSQKAIAEQLSRNAATISQEIKRNGGQRGYRPKQAQEFCESRRSRAYIDRRRRHKNACTGWQR